MNAHDAGSRDEKGIAEVSGLSGAPARPRRRLVVGGRGPDQLEVTPDRLPVAERNGLSVEHRLRLALILLVNFPTGPAGEIALSLRGVAILLDLPQPVSAVSTGDLFAFPVCLVRFIAG